MINSNLQMFSPCLVLSRLVVLVGFNHLFRLRGNWNDLDRVVSKCWVLFFFVFNLSFTHGHGWIMMEWCYVFQGTSRKDRCQLRQLMADCPANSLIDPVTEYHILRDPPSTQGFQLRPSEASLTNLRTGKRFFSPPKCQFARRLVRSNWGPAKNKNQAIITFRFRIIYATSNES